MYKLITVFLYSIVSCFSTTLSGSYPSYSLYHNRKKPDTHFEKMAIKKLQMLFGKHATQHKEPTVEQPEEFAAWGLSIVTLYHILQTKINKKIVIPFHAFDRINAYNQYPIYKSVGHYPSYKYMGIPSCSMFLSLLFLALWKNVKRTMQFCFLGNYKSLADIIFTQHEALNISNKELNVLRTTCINIKEELLEKELYKYLYLAGGFMKNSFDHLEDIIGCQNDNDYYVTYKLFELSKKILEFAH